MKRFARLLLILPILFGNNVASAQNANSNETLFQRFGGSEGISKIIDDFLVIWKNDSRISGQLDGVDMPHLAMRLKEQITMVTGGSDSYKGKDMKTIHDGLNIHNGDFNAVVEDLQQAMDDNDVPTRVQNKLLARLAPMHRDIVTESSAAPASVK